MLSALSLADGAATLFQRLLGSEKSAPSSAGAQAAAAPEEGSPLERNLREYVATKLRLAGIETTQPIELHDDGLGGLRVTGEIPNRSAIERLFADDREFLAQLQKLGSADSRGSIRVPATAKFNAAG